MTKEQVPLTYDERLKLYKAKMNLYRKTIKELCEKHKKINDEKINFTGLQIQPIESTSIKVEANEGGNGAKPQT